MNDKNANPSAGGSPDYSRPVAYDNQGRPLYAHPPDVAAEPPAAGAAPGGQPVAPAPVSPLPPAPGPSTAPVSDNGVRYVHVARPANPENPEIPPEIRERHEASRRKYPRLNLSEGEFVISDIRRHPIGLVQIWLIAFALIAALVGLAAPLALDSGQGRETLLLGVVGMGLVSLLIFAGAMIATYVYQSNRFFLTNESVIQEIQSSIFARHEQTVSLANIEDASFYKHGILPHIFNYGLIRLSTEGDETTYRFSYVSNPGKQISTLNNAVEAFKNGRSVLAED